MCTYYVVVLFEILSVTLPRVAELTPHEHGENGAGRRWATVYSLFDNT